MAKIIINNFHKTIIVPAVLYVCGRWSYIKENHGLRFFEYRLTSRIFGHLREKSIMRTFVFLSLTSMLKKSRMSWIQTVTRTGAKRNKHRFMVENLKEINTCEGKDAKIKLKSILKQLTGKCVD
jgi:hypothetical protein